MAGEAPGIYFEESAQRVQITPANASLAAFVGRSKRGRTDIAELVTSWADYVEKYGGFHPANVDLGNFLYEYFANGGSQARVLRIVGSSSAGASNTGSILRKDAGGVALTAHAANPGKWGDALTVSTLLKQVQAIGAPNANAVNGSVLPNTVSNANSLNTARLSVPSLVGINLGDIYDVFNPATGARVAEGPITVIGYDSVNSAIYVQAPANFIANCPASPILRTNSQHRAKVFATEELAVADTEIMFDSVEGIGPGSLLSLSLFSHCESRTARSITQLTQGIVDRVVGRKVIFVAAPANAVAIPASTAAFLRYIASGGDGIDFTADAPGTGGNTISVTILTAQAANGVAVVGRNIRISIAVGGPWTTQQVVDGVNGHATASTMVTAARVGADVATTALAQTMLTGGANLMVQSQEFGIRLKEDGLDVEVNSGAFDYLSMIPTSSDYIGKRVGGTTSPLVPADTNPSRRLILAGGDADVDTAATELTQLPLAIESVTLSGGEDGDTLTDDQLIGTSNPRTGIYLLDGYDDIDFAAAPTYTSTTFMRAADAYAKARADLEWLFDLPQDLLTHDAMLKFRQVDAGIDSTYSQLFGPWGKITDPRPEARRGTLMTVPPTPMVAALIAKAVNEGGAHASAGNQQPVTWVQVLANVTQAEHGSLNEGGVCIIRQVSRRGLRLYGDRTLSQSGDSRKFGNVRRWLNYFKQSVGVSLGAMVFKPANTDLFDDVESAVDSFLEREWKKGALFPRESKRQAYYVKVDSETTTAADLTNGEVVGDVGVSPVTPAEKIRFRLNVSAGGVAVDEA